MPEPDSFRLLAVEEFEHFQCRAPMLKHLLAYWNGKRKGRRWPSRADIDPSEIKSLLAHVMLTDISRDPFRVRYRVVGTEIVRVARFDFTGRYLDQLTFESGDTMDWNGCYRELVEAGLPGFGVVHWQAPGAAHRWIEFLVCPLSNDGVQVTQCIAIEDYEPLKPTEFDSIGRAQATD